MAVEPSLAPQHEERAGQLVVEIGLVVLEVDRSTGAVVLAGGMDACSVAEAALVLRERLRREELITAAAPRTQVPAEEEARVASDQPLGQVEGLAQEEPVVGRERKLLVRASEDRVGGHDVEGREPRHTFGVVERQPMRDAAASVVSDEGEPIEPELRHHRDLVTGHRPLRILEVRGAAWRL